MTQYEKDLVKAASVSLPWHLLSEKNILVLGATGLIGGCVVDVLMHRSNIDFTVYAAGRNRSRAEECFGCYIGLPNFHFLELDVTQSINCGIDFQFIIDAASGANPKLYSSDPVGIMRTNFLGVDHLLSYGISHGLERFVYVSSGEVYGEGDGRMFTEDYSGYVDPMKFRSCYPSSKRAAETLCVSYAHQYGISVSVARPSHVYGPNFTETDNRVYAQFIRNVLYGEDIVMKSRGLQMRSWCYVVDCALGLLYVLLKGITSEAYNVADNSSNLSILQLAEMIAGIAGRKVIVELPSEEEKSGFTPITHATFDTTKLESLGWKIEGNMLDKMKATIYEASRLESLK